MTSENYYEILGVDSNAHDVEIRSAYYEKARIYHPDAANGDRTHFEQIQNAYQTLLDPHSRAAHDRDLESGGSFRKPSLNHESDANLMGDNNSFEHEGREQGLLKRFLNGFIKSFSKKANQKPKSVHRISGDYSKIADLGSATTSTLRTAVYSEHWLPLAAGESLKLYSPQNPEIVKRCTEILAKSFQQYPIIERAVMIEVKAANAPEQDILLVVIDKQISKNSGIDSLQSVEIKNYPDSLPGILICSAGEGPFSEAVRLYGIEFYPLPEAGDFN